MSLINETEQTQNQQTQTAFTAPLESKAVSNKNQTINDYQDSYSLAKNAIKFGNIAKLTGFVSAGIISFLGLFLTLILVSNYRDAGMAFVVFLILVTVGAIFGALFYGLGIALTALGQNLSATLDSAVQVSTFMKNEQKAQAMNIEN